MLIDTDFDLVTLILTQNYVLSFLDIVWAICKEGRAYLLSTVTVDETLVCNLRQNLNGFYSVVSLRVSSVGNRCMGKLTAYNLKVSHVEACS